MLVHDAKLFTKSSHVAGAGTTHNPLPASEQLALEIDVDHSTLVEYVMVLIRGEVIHHQSWAIDVVGSYQTFGFPLDTYVHF